MNKNKNGFVSISVGIIATIALIFLISGGAGYKYYQQKQELAEEKELKEKNEVYIDVKKGFDEIGKIFNEKFKSNKNEEIKLNEIDFTLLKVNNIGSNIEEGKNEVSRVSIDGTKQAFFTRYNHPACCDKYLSIKDLQNKTKTIFLIQNIKPNNLDIIDLNFFFNKYDNNYLYLSYGGSKHNSYQQKVVKINTVTGEVLPLYYEEGCATGIIEGQPIGIINEKNGLAAYIQQSQEFIDFMKLNKLECWYALENPDIDPFENRNCLTSLDQYSDDGPLVWILDIEKNRRIMVYKNLEYSNDFCRNKKRVIWNVDWIDDKTLRITIWDNHYIDIEI